MRQIYYVILFSILTLQGDAQHPITADILLADFPVFLDERHAYLQPVIVGSWNSYQLDSLERSQERLLKDEEQHYVDYRFSREYVSRLTHLKGDSLEQFIIRYRPSYDSCRHAANVDILVYISESLKSMGR